MCYMERSNPQVGVRELRQNLSTYLRRVAVGESFEVTERGRRVAVLSPLPEEATPLSRLVTAGRAEAPAGELLDLGLPEGVPNTRLSDALLSEREERI